MSIFVNSWNFPLKKSSDSYGLGLFCLQWTDLVHSHSRFMFSLCLHQTEKAPTNFFVSAWFSERYGRDSNPRPPAWQAGILTSWTTTPMSKSSFAATKIDNKINPQTKDWNFLHFYLPSKYLPLSTLKTKFKPSTLNTSFQPNEPTQRHPHRS